MKVSKNAGNIHKNTLATSCTRMLENRLTNFGIIFAGTDSNQNRHR
jgi:hypothetical protein